MSGKMIGGAILVVLLVIAAAVLFGVFEETQDGPLESAGEAVDSTVDEVTD